MKDKDELFDDEREKTEQEEITQKEIVKQQKEFQQGIEAEEYDIKQKVKSDDEIDLEGKEGIEINYSFNGEEVVEGLKIYQKETIYKRNLIYSGILLIIFVLYVIGIAKDPSQIFSMFLAVMCITVLAFIWYLPNKHIKATAKAADLNKMEFSMVVYDNCIKIGEQGGTFVLSYNKEVTKIIETVKLYLICAGKERMFILPKRCLKDGENKQVKEIFITQLKDNYIKKLS